MSEDDEKGFLARWARRKQQARIEPEPTTKREVAEGEAAAEAEDEPFDLEMLPSLEDITAETDVTVFLHKAVPESLRNAALKRAWLLDPMIRDYVNPAMEYAYDWNTPGLSPSGPLEATYDALGEMARIMTSSSDKTLVEDSPAIATDQPAAEPLVPPTSGVDPDRQARETVASAGSQDVEKNSEFDEAGASGSETRVVAPDRLRRARPRHGGATPS